MYAALRLGVGVLCAWALSMAPIRAQTLHGQASEAAGQAGYVSALIDSGIAYENTGHRELGLRYCRLALQEARARGLPLEEAVALRMLSGIYYLRNDYAAALALGKQALAQSERLHNDKERFSCHMNLGDIYLEQGQDKAAMRQYLSSLRLIDKQPNPVAVGRLYNSLGHLNNKLKNHDKAIGYYKLAVARYRAGGDRFAESSSISHIGISFSDKHQPDSALRYYLLARDLKENAGDVKGLPSIYNNIGTIYFQKKQYPRAALYFQKALDGLAGLEQKSTQATFYNNLGEVSLMLNQPAKARRNLDSALRIGTRIAFPYSLVGTYELLAKLAEREKDYPRALAWQRRFAALKDSIYNLESARNVNETIIRYESEMKDKEIKVLSAERRSREARAKEQLAARNLLIVVIAALGLLALAALAAYFAYKRRQAQRAFLVQVIASQEEERKRISKELHDGIGQSLVIIKNNMTDDKALIETTIEELRALSRNLHPVQLEKLGFARALESVAEQAAAATGIYFTTEIDPVDDLLDSGRQMNVYRIVQECVNNIVKHARASSARITVTRTDQRVLITVLDDGVGFDLAAARRQKTLGLTSIAERTLLMGGELSVSSEPGRTKIAISLRHG